MSERKRERRERERKVCVCVCVRERDGVHPYGAVKVDAVPLPSTDPAAFPG